MTRASTFAYRILAVLLATTLASRAQAQFVLGPGPDAFTLPRGAFRTTLTGDHGLDRGRFVDGERGPAGSLFDRSAFGAAEHSALLALNNEAAAAGVSGLNASLGPTRVNLRQRVATTRFGLEYGLTSRITVGVDVPFVRTRAEALLRLRGDSGLATAGLNPILLGTAVAATNSATIQAYQAAVASLVSRRSDCQGNAGAHAECGIILAETAQVDGLLGNTSQFAQVLGRIYGGTGFGGGLPFVPMAGSNGETALLDRSDTLRVAFERYGVTSITPTTGLPLGAQAPLTASQLATMVGAGWSNGGGFGAKPMTKTAFQQIGDVDVNLRFLVIDNLSARDSNDTRLPIRQTLGVVYRIGSGYIDREDNFIDLGSGSGVSAVGIRSYTDVRLRDRVYATATLGVTLPGEHSEARRIADSPNQGWLEAFRRDGVRVSPGAIIELGLAPRAQLTDYLVVGAEWRYRQKGEDALTLASTGPVPSYGEFFTLNVDQMEAESAWSEHRLAWSIAFSTLPSVRAGSARRPIEIGYTHEQVVSSARGIVPERFTDRIQLRYYARFLGR